MRRTVATAAAAAVVGAGGVAAAAPARAAVIDPSAYGIAASGPITLGAQPAVDWTSGSALSATSPGLSRGPISVGPIAVAAGDGIALVHLANLHYGSLVAISSLTATCSGGHSAVTVAGTADGAPLRPGIRVRIPGGYVEIGATTANPDGSVTVVGLTLAVDGEVLLAAVARC